MVVNMQTWCSAAGLQVVLPLLVVLLWAYLMVIMWMQM